MLETHLKSWKLLMEKDSIFVKKETFGQHTKCWYNPHSDYVARGTFGIVYRAKTGLFFGETVALKVVHLHKDTEVFSNPEKWKMMRDRMKLLTDLKHDNLIGYRTVTFNRAPGGATVELVMDYCTGGDLDTLLKSRKERNARLSPTTAINFALQIAKGLEFLHRNNIIHGDLKTKNVLVAKLREGEHRLLIGDLDDAVQMQQTVTCSRDLTHLRGTIRYMSPEMLKKFANVSTENPGRNTDIWSLGCIMVHLAASMLGTCGTDTCLRQPFGRAQSADGISDEKYMIMIIDGYVPVVPETLRPGFAQCADRCLQIASSERISARELVQELKIENQMTFLLIIRTLPAFEARRATRLTTNNVNAGTSKTKY